MEALPPLLHMVQQHCDELPILLRRRAALWTAECADMDDLRQVDQQIDAHLEGVRLAGETGWDMIWQQFTDDPCADTVMAVAHLAVIANAERRMPLLDGAITQDAGLARAAAVGIGWHGPGYVQQAVPWLLGLTPPAAQAIGLALSLLCGLAVPADLGRWIGGPPLTRADAIMLAGWAGRVDLLAIVAAPQPEDTADIHAARVFGAALLGDGAALLAETTPDAQGGNRSDTLLAITTDPALARSWPGLYPAGTPAPLGTIAAAGSLGLAALVPWLLDQTAHESHRAAATLALRRITGADISTFFADADEPALADPFGTPPTPAAAPVQDRLHAWWRENALSGQHAALWQGEVATAATLLQARRGAVLRDHALLTLRARIMHGATAMAQPDAPFPYH